MLFVAQAMQIAPAKAVTTPLCVFIAALICLPKGYPATTTSSNKDTSSLDTENARSGIISVFKMNVFIRSALFIVLLSYLSPYLGIISSIFQLIIIIFNILIYIVSTKSNDSKLKNMDLELSDINKIIH